MSLLISRSKLKAAMQLLGAACLLAGFTPVDALVSLERSIVSDGMGDRLGAVSAMLPGLEDTLLVLETERGSLIEFKGEAGAVYRLSGSGKAFKTDDVQGLSRLSDDRLLVSNASDDVVSVVDSSGRLVSVLLTGGGLPGELSDPHGIAWSGNRRLYVADRGHHRISVFGDDGVFIRSIGSETGSANGALDEPVQVLVDAREHVYVLETRDRGIVSIFTHQGELLKRYDVKALGKITGGAPGIAVIAIDETGLLYIADNDNARIYQIDWQADQLLASFGSKGEQRGQFEKITALVALPGDKLAIADSGNRKIDIYRLPANRRVALEKQLLPGAGYERSIALKCSQAYRLRGGSVLCLDADNHKLGTFNASGHAETEFEGEFNDLIAAAINDQDVAILDGDSLRIYRLDGVQRFSVAASGNKDGQLDSPRGVFIRDDKIYVADTGNRRIQVFSKAGVFLNSINNPVGDQPAIFIQPTRVVVDTNGYLYVLEKQHEQVLVFGPDHSLLYRIGGEADEALFEAIYDIAIDVDNNLYILAAVPGNEAAVIVYNGPSRVMSFGAASEQAPGMQRPVTLSIAPESKTVVSVYDKELQALMNYKYLQLPTRPGGLEASGSLLQTRLSWQKVPGSYISHYKVYAARSPSGPFRYIANVDKTEVVIEHKNAIIPTHYRVSATSHFGVEGEWSNIREDVFQNGYALYRDMKYDEALQVFATAFADKQDNGELLKYLGLTLMALGKVEDAEVYFRKLCRLPGYEAEGRKQQLRALVGLKKYDAANKIINLLIADNTASVDDMIECGELNLMLGDAVTASRCLESVLIKQPNNIKAHFLMGSSYFRLAAPEKGLAEFNSAVSLDPQNPEVCYQHGRLLLENNRHEQAVESLQKALELNPDYSAALLALARSQLALQHYDEVRSLAGRLAGEQATQADGYYLQAMAALGTGDEDEALQALEESTRADETYTAAWLALADIYVRRQQSDKVRSALVNAGTGDSGSYEAVRRLGLLDYEAGDYMLAVQSLERATMLSPGEYEIQYKLADALYRSGTYKQAREAATGAGHIKPDAPEPLLLQARIADRQGKIGMAIDLARSAADKAALVDQVSAEPYVLLAALYVEQRAYDEAIAALELAVKLDATAKYKDALDAVYAEKKRSVVQGDNVPRITFRDVKFERVFSATYKKNKKSHIGTVVLQNDSVHNYANLKLSFVVNGYMDFPATVDIARLGANSILNVPLEAEFSPGVTGINEDTGVLADVTLNFVHDWQSSTISVSQPLTIYGKNAMLWSKANMIGIFVTPMENMLHDFVRAVISENKPDTDTINNNLLMAMTLFDVFGARGISYVEDPYNPYSKLTRNEVDTVQFPRETLKIGRGDCDDLTVLLSASLEALNIETAILDVPGHLLMMFNTGVPESESSQLSLDESWLVIRNGSVWVPLEATMIGQSFIEAWKEGARKFHTYVSSKQLSIIPLSQAWREFKPVTLKPDTYSPDMPPKSRLAPILLHDENLLLEKSLERLVAPYRAMISVDPLNLEARTQVATIYARHGLYEAAEYELDAIHELTPDSSEMNAVRSDLYFNRGDYARALDYYTYAEKLNYNDADIKIHISMVYFKQGNLQLASIKYAEASMIDAGITRKYEDFFKLLPQ